LSPATRDYFLSLNLFLANAYGMSECGGATAISEPENFKQFDEHFLVSTGRTLDGTEIMIHQPDKDGNGEICYRGRHVFMGYYKNEEATRQTIDEFKYIWKCSASSYLGFCILEILGNWTRMATSRSQGESRS
jgi:long-chain-fatty-acid--CoA ligase ACSBG